MALLEVRGLAKSFNLDGRVLEVIQDVSFTLERNEIIVIMGPSGCGKTTLIKIIAGVEKPTKGEVLYKGVRLDDYKPRIGVVFQSPSLVPWLTALENVALPLEARGVEGREARETAYRYLSLVGLSGFEDSYPWELSRGMNQRVALARALVVNPELLLLDEPFSQLDPLTAENLRAELLDLWHAQLASIEGIILVTHIVDEAVLMADRIIVMSIRPSRVVAEIKVGIPRPRNRWSSEFKKIVDQLYEYM